MSNVPVLKKIPVVKDMSRRDVFFGATGVVLGGAVATATGLGAYSYYKSRGYYATQAALKASIDVQDGWLITASDRANLSELQKNEDSLVESD